MLLPGLKIDKNSSSWPLNHWANKNKMRLNLSMSTSASVSVRASAVEHFGFIHASRDKFQLKTKSAALCMAFFVQIRMGNFQLSTLHTQVIQNILPFKITNL